MKRAIVFLLMLSLCAGISYDVFADDAPKKLPSYTTLVIKRRPTVTPTRSIAAPIIGVFDAAGDSLTLESPENDGEAFVTISGSGYYYTDAVSFIDGFATLDVSELGIGSYDITIEFENGAVYTGSFEFI